MHGLSVDHMIKLLNMTTLDHILDKYEIQVIEHNDETPIIPNRNIIWIFIKKNPNPQVYHFTILVL